jgi:hypothetical protein
MAQVEVLDCAKRLHTDYCIPALLSAAAENPGESGVFILGGKKGKGIAEESRLPI